MDRNISNLKSGIKAGLPIFIGYIPIAIAFGILAKNVGITLIEAILFSCLVFAGASQFVALNMINLGISIGEIVVTTLLLNFRHFLMSASLATRLKEKNFLVPIVAFGVTDETFSVSSLSENELDTDFILGINSIAYIGWVSGTIIGFLSNDLLPEKLQLALGLSLYAMFVGILVPAVKSDMKMLSVVLISGITHTLLNYVGILNSGWNIILSIIVGAVIGELIIRKGK